MLFRPLFVGSQYRDTAVIGQALGMRGFKQGNGIALVFGNSDQYINIIILYKIIHRFKEITHREEIKLRFE